MRAKAPKALAARCDALCIQHVVVVDPSLLGELLRQKLARQRTVVVGPREFELHQFGARGRSLHLSDSSGHVFVGPAGVLVELSVDRLARHVLADNVQFAVATAGLFGCVGSAEVQEFDLAADVDCAFAETDLAGFVGKHRNVGQYRVHRHFTGFRLGACFTVYDKRRELAQRTDGGARARLEHALWVAGGWDGSSPVWRVEVRFRKRMLNAYELRDPRALCANADGAWQAMTSSTLRLVVPGTAQRRERCDLDHRWRAVQSAAFVRRDARPLPRLEVQSQGASLEHAVGSVVSYLGRSGQLDRIDSSGAQLATEIGQRLTRAMRDDTRMVETLADRVAAARVKLGAA